MAFVYILRSEASGRYYIGSSTDLVRRMEEHGRGHSPATRGRGPWRLVYQEEYATLAEGRRRERQIKRWKSARLIDRLIASRSG